MSLTTSSRLSAAPRALSATIPGRIALALAAILFVALCAHASVRLPFTPVPLTLGDMAVLLVGLLLSPATAFAAMVAYLLEGALGLPVFNPGGLGGVAQIAGPTGGYLLAYPFAAALASFVRKALHRLPSQYLAAAIAASLGTALILLSGVAWLAHLPGLTLRAAFFAGAWPFLPGQLVKIAAVAGIATSVRRLRRA